MKEGTVFYDVRNGRLPHAFSACSHLPELAKDGAAVHLGGVGREDDFHLLAAELVEESVLVLGFEHLKRALEAVLALWA